MVKIPPNLINKKSIQNKKYDSNCLARILKIWQLKPVLESMVINFKNQIWQQVSGQNFPNSGKNVDSKFKKSGYKCLVGI